MFDALTGRLTGVFDRLRGKGRLGEKDVDAALREVRLALLEADVNVGVAKAMLARVRERGLGAEVTKSLSPGQQVIKIVHEELIATLGTKAVPLASASKPPLTILMVGLQGSGKTTTAAKLARRLQVAGKRPLLVAADLQRPAAIDQLETLGASHRRAGPHRPRIDGPQGGEGRHEAGGGRRVRRRGGRHRRPPPDRRGPDGRNCRRSGRRLAPTRCCWCSTP